MDKFMDWSEIYILPFANKLNENKYLTAVKDAMIITIPFLIVGSIFLIISSFPLPAWTDFLVNNPTGIQLKTYLGYAVRATFDTISIVTLVAVAYNLSVHYNLDRLIGPALALIGYFTVTPITFFVGETKELANGLALNYMNSQALFVALIVGLISVEIYRFVLEKNWTIKMPGSVPPSVARSFESLIPSLVIVLFFLLARIVLEFTAFENIHNVFSVLLTEPLSKISGTLFGAIMITFLMQFLWSFGIHGAAIVWTVMQPVLNIMLDANRIAFESGVEVPNILTKEWFNIFVMMGGSGGTLVLVLMMTFLAKSDQLKELGKLSLGSSLFNINEPVLFGMPIVMNPILMIPFIVGPVIVTVISYVAMSLGLVAKVITIVPWSTPPILGGFLITGGHISGAILQIVNLIVLAVIYYPFFRMYDKQLTDEQNNG